MSDRPGHERVVGPAVSRGRRLSIGVLAVVVLIALGSMASWIVFGAWDAQRVTLAHAERGAGV